MPADSIVTREQQREQDCGSAEMRIRAAQSSNATNAAPKNAAPKNATPKNATPKKAVPKNTAPYNTAPYNTAPYNTVPKKAQPKKVDPPKVKLREAVEMGNEISRLAALVSAGTHRLLEAIREFDAGKGWAHSECMSCANWLTWKVGLDPRTAREWVRVARALGELPHIDAAFSRGELSYSKTRALTRVATAQTDETFSKTARYATGSQLDKTCRLFRRVVNAHRDREDAVREGTEGEGAAAEETFDRSIHTTKLPSGKVRLEFEVYADEAELLIAIARAGRDAWRAREREAEATRDGSGAESVEKSDVADADRETELTSEGEGGSAEPSKGQGTPARGPAEPEPRRGVHSPAPIGTEESERGSAAFTDPRTPVGGAPLSAPSPRGGSAEPPPGDSSRTPSTPAPSTQAPSTQAPSTQAPSRPGAPNPNPDAPDSSARNTTTTIERSPTEEPPHPSDPGAAKYPTKSPRGRVCTRIGLIDGLLLAGEWFLEQARRGKQPRVRKGGDRHQVLLLVPAREAAADRDARGTQAPELRPAECDPLSGSRGHSKSSSPPNPLLPLPPPKEPIPSTDPSPPAESPTPAEPISLADLIHRASRDGFGRLKDGTWLPRATVERICCDAGIVPVLEDAHGKTLDVGRKRRTIPPSIRTALEVRDGGCRFPGCHHQAFVEAHHIEHWGCDGETNLENLVLLCHPHHVLLHEGGFRAEMSPDGVPLFFDRRGQLLADRCDEYPLLALGSTGEKKAPVTGGEIALGTLHRELRTIVGSYEDLSGPINFDKKRAAEKVAAAARSGELDPAHPTEPIHPKALTRSISVHRPDYHQILGGICDAHFNGSEEQKAERLRRRKAREARWTPVSSES